MAVLCSSGCVFFVARQNPTEKIIITNLLEQTRYSGTVHGQSGGEGGGYEKNPNRRG